MINETLQDKRILVTGSPGFIGAALVAQLLQRMESGTVVSLDNMSDYYNINLKKYRLREIMRTASRSRAGHVFIEGSIADKALLEKLFDVYHFDIVVNLAAQAGVRYSIENPDLYIESNIIGFYNILEICRSYGVSHLVFASSSSVYGGNKKIPFSVNDMTDRPVSLYAATKKSDELLAYTYSRIYDIPTTGLRFFTVYGPAGRPDMFYYKATQKFMLDEKVQIYNYGNMERDFTYIDDIVDGILRVMVSPPYGSNIDSVSDDAPYALYNIGRGNPENIMNFYTVLQEELIEAKLLPDTFDFNAHTEFTEMQPGDVQRTYADTTAFEKRFGFVPKTDIRTGIRNFVEWYAKQGRRFSLC